VGEVFWSVSRRTLYSRVVQRARQGRCKSWPAACPAGLCSREFDRVGLGGPGRGRSRRRLERAPRDMSTSPA
jgi:hypothetical protein